MSLDVNRDYYEAASPGRLDYWRYMAAPRARVSRVLSALRQLAPASVVDLGCGDGSLLQEIRVTLPSVRLAGIDLSARQIEENQRRTPEIAWHAANLLEPVTLPDRFEAVVASEVIEHLDDAEALLRNAAVLASNGGTLVLTTQSGRVGETERRVGHVRHFSRDEMESLLGRCGWDPEGVWNEGFPFHDLSKWWANRDPDASMSRFGGASGYSLREKAICFALRAAFLTNSRRHGAQLYAVARKQG